MKKLFLGIAVLLAFGMMAVSAMAGQGNGMPSGPHYNLNLIGSKTEKDALDGPSGGHRIFIRLDGRTKLYMTQLPGQGFEVLDANGVDDLQNDPWGVAKFRIADFPDDDPEHMTHWLVFARALGKQNKEITIVPEATWKDPWTGEELFCLGVIKLSHSKKPKTENITGLFYVDVTLRNTVTGATKSYSHEWIFDIAELDEYYWDMDNKGCKLIALRFYKGEYPCPKSPHEPPAAPAKGNPTTTWGAIKG